MIKSTLKLPILKILVLISVCLVCIGVVHAEGMKVNPGLWETKSHVTSPGGEHENVSQDCIKESEFSPETMMDNNSGCKVTDSNSDAKSMQWTLQCENGGVAMTGSGHAKSTGDSITGGMDIKANFNGVDVTMTTKWQGTRIGECK